MDLLIFFGVGFSTGLAGAMIPGPLTLYTISEAFRKGHLVGPKIALGHLLLESGFVALVVLGLQEPLSSPALRLAVSWLGGVGLVVMGGLILAKVRRLSLSHQSEVVFHGGPLLGGAFFSLASPGFLSWWATIGTAVFLQGAWAGPAGLTMVSAGHATADLSWCWLVAFSIERGRRCCSDRAYRLMMAAIAACLIVLGAGLPAKEMLIPS